MDDEQFSIDTINETYNTMPENLYICNCHWEIVNSAGVRNREIPAFFVQATDPAHARDRASRIVDQDPLNRERGWTLHTDCQPV